MLVLGEAYSKCQIPETRKDLAAAVRRGFAGLGITGQDDAEYVKNAMCWYEKEKDNVIVSYKYTMNPPGTTSPEFLLFEKKPAAVVSPSRNPEPVEVPARPPAALRMSRRATYAVERQKRNWPRSRDRGRLLR